MAIVLALLFVVLWIVVMAGPEALRERLQAAGDAVAAVAAIAAAGAALVAVRQLEIQQVALAEQRRALGSQRFHALRGEYSLWLERITQASVATPDPIDYNATLIPLSHSVQRVLLAEQDRLRSLVMHETSVAISTYAADGSDELARLIVTTADLARRVVRICESITPVSGGLECALQQAAQVQCIDDVPEPSLVQLSRLRAELAAAAMLCLRASLVHEESTGTAAAIPPECLADSA